MKIKTILLDLDDVLNSFTLYVMNALGWNHGVYDYHKYPTERRGKFDIVGTLNMIRGEQMTPGDFWAGLFNDQLFGTAPKSEQCDWLISRCRYLVGKENVFICTSPTLSDECCAQKNRWIRENLPHSFKRQFAITPRKSLLARPDVLLIDDSDGNVDKFRMAGGQAILCPRPWNSLHVFGVDKIKVDDYLVQKLESKEWHR